MPFVKNSVKVINDQLKENLLRSKTFSEGKVYGLVELTQQNTESGVQRYPVEIEDGYVKDVTVNDTYPFQLYHRQLGARYQFESDNQYGDANNYIQKSVNMVMVAYAKLTKLGLTSDELETMLILASPTEVPKALLKGTNVDSLVVSITGSELDSFINYGEEYQKVEFPLGQEDALIKISYTIEMRYRRGCIDICDC